VVVAIYDPFTCKFSGCNGRCSASVALSFTFYTKEISPKHYFAKPDKNISVVKNDNTNSLQQINQIILIKVKACSTKLMGKNLIQKDLVRLLKTEADTTPSQAPSCKTP
jgi:hypothetical protein